MFDSTLIDRLPIVRGRISENASLAPQTWFRVGGSAEVLFKPADADDLAHFLAGCPDDVPLTVIGMASNMIIRDGGIPGVVIKLGREFAQIEIDDQDYIVTAGAGALDLTVAKTCAKAGLGGLEFLSGIPGSIGGALRMNAGSYGSEMVDVLISAEVLTRDGQHKTLTLNDMNLTYRHNDVPENTIFLSATMRAVPEEPSIVEGRMSEIKRSREESQPIRERTGGSTFANPDGHKAWQLIDEAGCRGLMIGGAQMSEKHCNFMINTGNATAADLEELGETVRKRVKETSGIELRWEIRRLGNPIETDLAHLESAGIA